MTERAAGSTGRRTTPAAGRRAGRIHVVVNPVAGHVDPGRLRPRIEEAFAAHGETVELAFTRAPGHATELARGAVTDGARLVCAVGGDGTLAEIAAALAGRDTPLAILPAGTANQIAANLRIPTGIDAAVAVALHGQAVAVDVGSIGARVFALAAGAGFDAAVIARATRELKERWGFGAYIFATLKEAASAPRTEYRIVADGDELRVQAMCVMVANVGAIFSVFPPLRIPVSPEPESALHDGRFDVVVLAPSSMPRFAGMLVRLALHGFGGEGLLHLRAREVRIDASPTAPIEIDGDPAGHTPLVATVRPRALRILTPRPEP